jgi:signal transduction histidine kinase
VDLGSRRADKASDPKLSQYFQRIDESGQRLLSLIDELLDLSKLDAGKTALQTTRFNALELVRQVLGQLESLQLERQLQIDIDCQLANPVIDADEKRITQVICNLLSNAIKFSPEGGTIRVVLAASDLRGTIVARNNPGQGACFVVTLPLNCRTDKSGQHD